MSNFIFVFNYCVTDCGEEPTIANGFVTSGSSEVGARRTIQCNFGYEISGSGSITCQADSTWTLPGSCIRGKLQSNNIYLTN